MTDLALLLNIVGASLNFGRFAEDGNAVALGFAVGCTLVFLLLLTIRMEQR